MKALPKGVYERLLACAVTTCMAVADPAALQAQASPTNSASIPKPASRLPPLPPAVIDNTLLINGTDIAARKVETRMTVDVLVNGRGPYPLRGRQRRGFLGRSARASRAFCSCPLATPAILNGMTDRSLVDRVKVERARPRPSTIRNLQVPALREEDLGGQGMIGIDALVRQRLMMDFEKRLVKVEDARTPMQHYSR